MLDFVPNHMAPDHRVDRRAPGLFRPWQRGRPGARAAELLPGADPQGRAAAGPWPRPVFRRLARHAAARLRQPGPAAGDDRRAGAHRRAVRRCPVRHGDAGPARRVREHLGHRGGALLAQGHRRGAAQPSRLLLHGRGLLGPGVDDAAAGIRLHLRQEALRPACARAMPGRCASISMRRWTTRTRWPASWRTTTSRAPRRRSSPRFTRPRRSSPFWRRGCASCTRGNARAA